MSLTPPDLVQVIILGLKAIGIAEGQMNEAKGHILGAAEKLLPQDPEGIIRHIKAFADSPMSPEEIWERVAQDQRNSIMHAKIEEKWGHERLTAQNKAEKVAKTFARFARTKQAVRNGTA